MTGSVRSRVVTYTLAQPGKASANHMDTSASDLTFPAEWAEQADRDLALV